jgi:hypothetical protein
LNRRGRAGLKVSYCCVHTLRGLVRIKPEVIERGVANGISVLVLRDRFAVPCYRATGLSNSPGLTAVTLVVKGAVVSPTRFLRRRVEADVSYVHSRSHRHAERLNGAIEVLVVERVLVVPDAR